MPQLIATPTRITAAGNKPKIIEEFVGRVNNRETRLSVARMRSPGDWVEPGQTPEFDEFTLVLAGTLRVTHRDGILDLHAGQRFVAALANGSNTARPRRREPTISPYACPPFPRRPCIEMAPGNDLRWAGRAGYSFFSAGAATGASIVVVGGFTVAGAGAGIVCATGASCQWPCSTDHTFPGGAKPGG